MTHELQDVSQIGDQGALSIGEGLKVNSSLRILHLVRLVIFVCVCIVVLLLRERAGGGVCCSVACCSCSRLCLSAAVCDS